MANTYQFVSRTSQSASVLTTIVVTSGAGQAIPRGSLVVIRFSNSSGVLPSSVVDSAGHTYVLADSVLNTRRAAIYYVVTRKALPAGATFTANVAATSSSRMMDVVWCSRPNGTTATVLDAAATNAGIQHASGTGTAVATAAITPSGADSLLVSLETDAGAASATPAASWTEDSDTLVTAAVLHFESQTRILTAASSVAAAATLASSFAWEQVYAVFRLKPPIAYVKTASWNNTSSPPSTLAATVTQNAAIGDHILVRIFTGGLSPASACVDSVGNTYVRDDTGTFGGTGADYALFRSKLTAAHVAGTTTITITGGASAVFYAGDAIKVTGATSITRGEFTTSAEGTGTTVASPTIIPVTANWIALGGIDASFTSATPGTTGGTWVEDTDTNGFESQTLISTTFAQSAVGFAATVTPTQTFIDLGWNILQVDKPVVEVESVTGSSATSKTETFRAATAGDLLLLIVGTNENSGADNVTTPTGWTLLAQSRSGTTNVNLNLYGKIAVGGETSVLATGSLTARIQTAFANLGQGYTLTIDSSNTANSTSASLTGAVGSVTAVGSGGIAISAIAFKNAETTLVAGPANSTPYDQLGVNNEGSTASTQKVTVGWFYSEGVVAGAVYDNAPVVTGTSAPYAGLNVILQPASGTTPAVVTPATAAQVSASSIAITAPSLLGLSSSQVSASALAVTAAAALALSSAQASASTLAVTAPTFIAPNTAAQVSATSLAVAVPTPVVPATAVQVSATTLAVTAATRVVPATAASVSASTIAVTAPTFVVPATAAQVSATSLVLASSAPVAPAVAAQVSATTIKVTAPTFIAPATAASVSATTLAVTAPAALAPSTAASVSATSILVTAPLLLALATAVQVSSTTATVITPGAAAVVPSTAAQASASTLAVTAPTGVQLSASPSVSTTTLKVTAPTGLVLATAASVSTSQAFLTSATILALAAAGSVSTTSIQITATPLIVPATAAQVSSTTAKVVVQVFLTLASSQVSATTAVVTATGGATVSPSTASQVSTTSILVTAPTGVVTAVAAQTSATSIAVSAPSSLTLQTAASASSSTLALHSTPQIASTAPSVSSTSLVLGTGAALLPSPAASTATSSLALRAPVQLVLASAAVSASSIFVNSGNSLPPIIDDRNPTVPTYTSTPSSGATSLPVASRVDEGRYVSSNPTAIGLA